MFPIAVAIVFTAGKLASGEELRAIVYRTFRNPSERFLEEAENMKTGEYRQLIENREFPFYDQMVYDTEGLLRIRGTVITPMISRVPVAVGERKEDTSGEAYWTWVEGRSGGVSKELAHLIECMEVLRGYEPILYIEV